MGERTLLQGGRRKQKTACSCLDPHTSPHGISDEGISHVGRWLTARRGRRIARLALPDPGRPCNSVFDPTSSRVTPSSAWGSAERKEEAARGGGNWVIALTIAPASRPDAGHEEPETALRRRAIFTLSTQSRREYVATVAPSSRGITCLRLHIVNSVTRTRRWSTQ